MSGVYIQAIRECDQCSTRAPVEIELGQRDGQLTGNVESAIPEGWHERRVRSYGHGSYVVIMCPACAAEHQEDRE